MSVFVLGSVRSAPGVTTTACVLAGCLTNGVVAEADLDGGVAAIRYGLRREPGLTTLAASPTTDPDGWRHHAQRAGDVPVLVGPDTPNLAQALWSRAGDHLARAFDAADADVVVDAGRLRFDPALAPVLGVASVLAVVVRPEAEHLVALARRLGGLQEQIPALGVILVGQGAYLPRDVTEQLGVEVLGVLPDGPRAGTSPVVRDELARAARSLADALASHDEAHNTQRPPALEGAINKEVSV